MHLLVPEPSHFMTTNNVTPTNVIRASNCDPVPVIQQHDVLEKVPNRRPFVDFRCLLASVQASRQCLPGWKADCVGQLHHEQGNVR